MQFKDSGKLKAITFSYDDGMTQDVRLIELLNKYDLKSTFHINSGKLGLNLVQTRDTGRVARYRIHADDIKYIYEGHEIATHTLTHSNLTALDDAEVIRQVEQDRLRLSELAGYEVVGLAYPCSEPNHDDRVVELIRSNTGIQYARTGTKTDSFDLQPDLLRFDPNLHHIRNKKRQEEITRRFIETETDKPQILCVYGHSYEMDFEEDAWARLEDLFAYLANREDIFYGTMKEVLT